MGLAKPSTATVRNAPNLQQPGSIFDLINFSVSEFMGVSGSLVTRICEARFGITREEWQFVAMLASMGQTSPSELASATTVDRSQTSKTLRELIKKGLVYRHTQPSDRRRAAVGITQSGEKLFQDLFPLVLQLHHSILEGISEDELKRFAQSLYRMQNNARMAFDEKAPENSASRRDGGSRTRWRKGGD